MAVYFCQGPVSTALHNSFVATQLMFVGSKTSSMDTVAHFHSSHRKIESKTIALSDLSNLPRFEKSQNSTDNCTYAY